MGTLDPRKLIEMNINRMNNFHMKISRITVVATFAKQLYKIIFLDPQIYISFNAMVLL